MLKIVAWIALEWNVAADSELDICLDKVKAHSKCEGVTVNWEYAQCAGSTITYNEKFTFDYPPECTQVLEDHSADAKLCCLPDNVRPKQSLHPCCRFDAGFVIIQNTVLIVIIGASNLALCACCPFCPLYSLLVCTPDKGCWRQPAGSNLNPSKSTFVYVMIARIWYLLLLTLCFFPLFVMDIFGHFSVQWQPFGDPDFRDTMFAWGIFTVEICIWTVAITWCYIKNKELGAAGYCGTLSCTCCLLCGVCCVLFFPVDEMPPQPVGEPVKQEPVKHEMIWVGRPRDYLEATRKKAEARCRQS